MEFSSGLTVTADFTFIRRATVDRQRKRTTYLDAPGALAITNIEVAEALPLQIFIYATGRKFLIISACCQKEYQYHNDNLICSGCDKTVGAENLPTELISSTLQAGLASWLSLLLPPLESILYGQELYDFLLELGKKLSCNYDEEQEKRAAEALVYREKEAEEFLSSMLVKLEKEQKKGL